MLGNRGRYSNVGDLLISKNLVRLLRDRGTLLLQTDLVRAPSKSAWELVSLHWHLFRSALRGRLGANIRTTLVLPPGQSMGKSLADAPRVLSQLGYLALLRAVGIDVVVFGRGFYCRSFVNHLQESGISRLAKYYSLRDRVSVSDAQSKGIRNAFWFPDLSWFGYPTYEKHPRDRPRSSLVLSFRADTDEERGMDRLSPIILERTGELIEEAIGLGLKRVVLVEHDRQDRALWRAIEEKYSRQFSTLTTRRLTSPEQLPDIYGDAAIVVSNRLHSLLLGLQWGASVVALISERCEQKVKNQFRDMGLESQIVDLKQPSMSGVIVRALSAWDAIQDAVSAYSQTAERIAADTLLNVFPQSLSTKMTSSNPVPSRTTSH